MQERKPVRKGLIISDKLAREVDDFRFEHRYRTDAEALRVLIEAGLKSLKGGSSAHAQT